MNHYIYTIYIRVVPMFNRLHIVLTKLKNFFINELTRNLIEFGKIKKNCVFLASHRHKIQKTHFYLSVLRWESVLPSLIWRLLILLFAQIIITYQILTQHFTPLLDWLKNLTRPVFIRFDRVSNFLILPYESSDSMKQCYKIQRFN